MFSGGKLSRIVPMPDADAIVTVYRISADIAFTEFGFANLISISHPDFRDESKASKRAVLA